MWFVLMSNIVFGLMAVVKPSAKHPDDGVMSPRAAMTLVSNFR